MHFKEKAEVKLILMFNGLTSENKLGYLLYFEVRLITVFKLEVCRVLSHHFNHIYLTIFSNFCQLLCIHTK